MSYHLLVDARYGRMIVNRHDMYVGRSFLMYGEFSEGEVDFLRGVVRPGMAIVEAGANYGAHTVPLAQMVGCAGTILAIEPQRLAYQALCGNLALNSLPQAHALQAAVGAAPGHIVVPVLDPDAPHNIGGLALGAHQEGERVPQVSIDSLDLRRLDLLKADVEGMEPDVLIGAVHTIRRYRPLLYLESDRDERRGELLALLRAHRYHAYWHCPPLYNPHNYARRAENVFGQIVSLNLLCVPREKPLRLTDTMVRIP
jgi:FkbM family methyltransferase